MKKSNVVKWDYEIAVSDSQKAFQSSYWNAEISFLHNIKSETFLLFTGAGFLLTNKIL